MKTLSLTLLMLVALSVHTSAWADQYTCTSVDHKTTGSALFGPNGRFVSGAIHFQGKDLNSISVDDENHVPGLNDVLVEDWNDNGASGFDIQSVYENGDELIFQMNGQDSNVAYFVIGKAMQMKKTICTFKP